MPDKTTKLEIEHYDFSGIVTTTHYSYSLSEKFYLCYGYGSRRSDRWPDENFQPLFSFFRAIENKLAAR